MKKILGLVVSERKLGNSEILLKEIMSSVPEPRLLELIRLTEIDIKPCRACYRCLKPDTLCRIKDGFNFVMSRIKEADAIIIGVPVYVLGPHGSLKMLTDRMLGASNYVNHIRGKPCVLVIPYGKEGYTGYSKTAALVLPRLLEMKILERWMVHAALPGECLINEEILDHARELGKRIFEATEFPRHPRECAVCGADLFRILPDGRVECSLCNTKGLIKADNTLEFSDPGQHKFSHQGIQHHGEWLADRKEEFMSRRQRIKEMQAPYRDKEWWVKPQ